MSAEHVDAHRPDLTRNQSLVLDTLAGADGPMTAYGILDQLSGEGMRAPQQVYRAMEKLQDAGLVHRLESLNAFVACRHDGCAQHETVAFIICDNCGQTSEISDEHLTASLEALTRKRGFSPRTTTIEMRGLCSNCLAA